MRTKKLLIIHPFLFAIFPILSLFVNNIGQVLFSETLLPTAIVLGSTLLLLLLLKSILNDYNKVGIIASIFLILFFSYEHICVILYVIQYFAIAKVIIEPRFLLLSCGIFFIACSFLVIKTQTNLHNYTKFLNIVAATLVIISVIRIGIYDIKTKSNWSDHTNMENIGTNNLHLKNTDALPDIYYIILDAYARADILKEIYHYDNSQFINHLTSKGFYVAHKSSSNYSHTYLSLASSLNLEYINYLTNIMGLESNNWRPLGKMIKDNKVCLLLKNIGYTFVTFSSGWGATDKNSNADMYIHPPWDLGEFENMFIKTTPLPILFPDFQYTAHRKRILYTFDYLANISRIKEPTFVFAHIVTPHPPFVFGRNGEKVKQNKIFAFWDGAAYHGTKQKYIEKYRNQLIYINEKLQKAVDQILSNSNTPPIIILQSDHGPGAMLQRENPSETCMKERMSILNAYYLPKNGKKLLYESITPVNSFRVIFNYYFKANYKILKDISYFSTWPKPYQFIQVEQ